MKVKFFSIFTVAASMLFAGSVFAQAMNVPTIKAEQVMSGLENPWDMAFTNGGDMFFTEKCKGLSVRHADGNVSALYGMKGSKGYKSSGKDLFCEGQAGMLGVALSKDFDKDLSLIHI